MSKLGSRNRWKVQRQLGLELPGLGRAGALDKRNFPPGQHGQARKKKISGYGLQLREKQKLIFHYGLREEQLRRFVRMAKQGAGSNWISKLLSLLESRIDNIVFRLGFARSIAGARQLVSHGHVLVNDRKLTIGSALVKVGDRIQLTMKAKALPGTIFSISSPRLSLPSYLQQSAADELEVGIVVSNPGVEHIPFEFNPNLVAEFYANRGVN
ncbi:30S ribosomal protein S4 [Bryobacter aggregatus]|uniref:30S ribosomal protein S4 n=1 Tax=Bryobacter aggregatus TaxID=360054 RepID=UPI0004E0BF19|nr:30S ribosomal protein S4 [Bryobacter aggregatus]